MSRCRTEPDEPSVKITAFQSRFTVAAWSYLDRFIVAGHEDGAISLFESIDGEEWDSRPKVHTDVITDLQMSPDRTYFVTSSKDKTAKLVSVDSLDTLKTFATETPLNSATILPGKPYIILGGGQEAMSVTTTSSRQGHFEVRVWHTIFEQELARIKGGFGPCNTLAAHPEGIGYALGAEDGYVRLHACVSYGSLPRICLDYAHSLDEDFLKAKPYGASSCPRTGHRDSFRSRESRRGCRRMSGPGLCSFVMIFFVAFAYDSPSLACLSERLNVSTHLYSLLQML